MLGVELGNLSMRYLGYTGATITLLALWMLSWVDELDLLGLVEEGDVVVQAVGVAVGDLTVPCPF